MSNELFGSGKCCKKDCGCQKFWKHPESLDPIICGCEHNEAFHVQVIINLLLIIINIFYIYINFINFIY